MAYITTSNFIKGKYIIFKEKPHQIVDFQHVNPGKGSAFVRTKLKSVIDGKVIEFTYKSGEQVEEVIILTREMQYLYSQNNNYIFMDNQTFEQYEMKNLLLGEFKNYLIKNETYQLLVYEGDIIGIRKPKKVKLKVIEADASARGNTQNQATKSAVLETGIRINVPMFIKQGDLVIVNPDTNEYLERAGI